MDRRDPVDVLRRSRTPPGCRSWCRSATGGCSPRRSRSSAARPRSWPPTSRPRRSPGSRVQLCGDAHLVELRRLRRARPPARLRHQRLRRDAARARGSGTSSGWPRASRSPAATAASTSGERATRSCAAVRAYREAMRDFAAMRNLDVWYARLDVDDAARAAGSAQATARRKTLERRRRQGAAQGQPARVRRSSPTIVDGAAADRQRPAADRAARASSLEASTS